MHNGLFDMHKFLSVCYWAKIHISLNIAAPNPKLGDIAAPNPKLGDSKLDYMISIPASRIMLSETPRSLRLMILARGLLQHQIAFFFVPLCATYISCPIAIHYYCPLQHGRNMFCPTTGFGEEQNAASR